MKKFKPNQFIHQKKIKNSQILFCFLVLLNSHLNSHSVQFCLCIATNKSRIRITFSIFVCSRIFVCTYIRIQWKNKNKVSTYILFQTNSIRCKVLITDGLNLSYIVKIQSLKWYYSIDNQLLGLWRHFNWINPYNST